MPPKENTSKTNGDRIGSGVRKLSIREGRLPGEGDAFEVTFKQSYKIVKTGKKRCVLPERDIG